MSYKAKSEHSQEEVIAQLRKEVRRLEELYSFFECCFDDLNNRLYFFLDVIRDKENEKKDPDPYITEWCQIGIHYIHLTFDEAHREKAAINEVFGGDHSNGK